MVPASQIGRMLTMDEAGRLIRTMSAASPKRAGGAVGEAAGGGRPEEGLGQSHTGL